MDLRQSLNEVARERAKNEQIEELAEGEEETLEFEPEIEDVQFWIQRELQYSKGYISSDPEMRKHQIDWSLEFLKIRELQEISHELHLIHNSLLDIHSKQ